MLILKLLYEVIDGHVFVCFCLCFIKSLAKMKGTLSKISGS